MFFQKPNNGQEIGKEVIIKGEFEFQGNLNLSGEIDGVVKAKPNSSINVLQGGRLKTDVLSVSSLEVHGLVEADEINVSTLVLHKNGVLNSKVNASSITVMPGATYQGFMNISPANKIESNTRKEPTLNSPASGSANVAKQRLQGLKDNPPKQ